MVKSQGQCIFTGANRDQNIVEHPEDTNGKTTNLPPAFEFEDNYHHNEWDC